MLGGYLLMLTAFAATHTVSAGPTIKQKGSFTVYKDELAHTNASSHAIYKRLFQQLQGRDGPAKVTDDGGVPRKFVEIEKCGNMQDPKSMGNKIIAAWDEARTLATAQTTFKPDFDFNKIHMAWLGKYWNSWGWFGNYYEITNNNFARLRKFFSTSDPPDHEFVYWYCYDYANECNPGTVAYSWSSSWGFWRNHYTVFCPIFESLQKLEDAVRDASKESPKQRIMENFEVNRGQVMLHEVYHYTAVSSPRTKDYAYKAKPCWDLARDWDSWYVAYNADSYALDAVAIYVQQHFNQAEPPIPRKYFALSPAGQAAGNDLPTGAGDQGVKGSKIFSGPPSGWKGGPVVELQPDPKFWSEFVEPGVTPLGPDLDVAAQVFGSQKPPSAPFVSLLVSATVAPAPEATMAPEPHPDPGANGIPAPQCRPAGQGVPFSQPPVEDFIQSLCGDKDLYNRVLVPPVAVGTGATSDGRSKALGVTGNYSIPGTTDILWLGVMFDNDNCIGFSDFGIGKDDSDKLAHCKARFDTVLNSCQTDTISAKLGGRLKDGCADYMITAVHAGDLEPYDDKTWWADLGDFICQPTDVSAIGDTLKDTCTCYYSGYERTTAVFKKPSSNDCKDVNKAELLNY